MDFLSFKAAVEAEVATLGDHLRVSFGRDGDLFVATLLPATGVGSSTDRSGLPRTTARVTTTGVESFFLELDDRLFTVDFEYVEPEQPAIAQRLVRLADAYFSGGGVLSRRRGWFGRTHVELRIPDQDGETVTFKSMRRS
jgi:hypothetical protein